MSESVVPFGYNVTAGDATYNVPQFKTASIVNDGAADITITFTGGTAYTIKANEVLNLPPDGRPYETSVIANPGGSTARIILIP